MSKRLSEAYLFLGEFFRRQHTTGAVLPSGRFLAAALTRYVALGEQPKRVLEVGPGTGAVTRRIASHLGPEDTLDLVELNDNFVQCLKRGLTEDPALRPVADRTRVMHCAVEDLPTSKGYDVIVSGLPLNNFSADSVARILRKLTDLLAPGGTLSFFEYIAIRKVRSMVSGRAQRERLREISRILDGLLGDREIRRDWVWPNVPPAWVHHVRIEGPASPGAPRAKESSRSS
jgi:phospholipid N-methyltransferase